VLKLDELLKLNGIILKKAELEKDFVGVYSKVFENFVELDSDELILVLGNKGA
jgi:hypothetical protein